jgi:hypothetical protein
MRHVTDVLMARTLCRASGKSATRDNLATLHQLFKRHLFLLGGGGTFHHSLLSHNVSVNETQNKGEADRTLRNPDSSKRRCHD